MPPGMVSSEVAASDVALGSLSPALLTPPEGPSGRVEGAVSVFVDEGPEGASGVVDVAIGVELDGTGEVDVLSALVVVVCVVVI